MNKMMDRWAEGHKLLPMEVQTHKVDEYYKKYECARKGKLCTGSLKAPSPKDKRLQKTKLYV